MGETVNVGFGTMPKTGKKECHDQREYIAGLCYANCPPNYTRSSSAPWSCNRTTLVIPITAPDLTPGAVRLPYPTDRVTTEIMLGTNTTECTNCALSMKSMSSISTVQLSRIVGAISGDECNQYDIDEAQVKAKRLSLFEFASRIHQGLYHTRKEAAQGYCRELGMSDANLQAIAQGAAFADTMLIYKRARPESGSGGFSGESKAVFEFALPIDIVFSGVSTFLRTTAEGPAPLVPVPRVEGFLNFFRPRVREGFFPLIVAAAMGAFDSDSGPSTSGGGTISDAFTKILITEPQRKFDDYVRKLSAADSPFATSTQEGTPEVRNVSRTVSVKSMSLYHPFPLRVNGVQYSAALAFNDPSMVTSGASTVLLIPLRITQSGDEPSAKFLQKIVRYLPAIRDIDPMSGLYPRATIPTGSDWNVGDLFNMKQPPRGATIPGQPNVDANQRLVIQNGFYVWSSHAGYDPVVQESTNPDFPRAKIQWHSWTPRKSTDSTLYIMLDSPLAIDSTDFVTLTRMLPATAPEKAIHLIPSNEKFIYHKTGDPPPDDGSGLNSNASPCSNDLCKESYLNYNSAVDFDRAKTQFDILKATIEKNYSATDYSQFLNNCPGAKCDVFLQNLKQVKLPDHRIFLRIIYSVLFLLAMVVGIYFALSAGAKGYHTNITAIGETFGKLAGMFARRWQTGVEARAAAAPPAAAPAASSGPSLLDTAMSFFKKKAKL